MSRDKVSYARKAFTLIELLVVISIIAVLMSILMPALGKVKEQAKKVVCSSSMHQLGLSLATYGGDNKGKYPGGVPDGMYPHNYMSPKPSPAKEEAEKSMAHIALIKNGYLDPVYLFCPAAKARNQLNYDDLLEHQELYYPGANCYTRTLNPDDIIIDAGWGMGYPYWVGYKAFSSNGSKFGILTSSEEKCRKLEKAIAANANSRGDRVAMTDLILTADPIGNAPWENPKDNYWTEGSQENNGVARGECNHITKGYAAGGNVLYNDGSSVWQDIKSMAKEKEGSGTDEEDYVRLRVGFASGGGQDPIGYAWF